MANGSPATATADTGWMNDVQKTLAYFTTVAYVVLIFIWTFFPPKMEPESMAQLNQMMTTLQTLLVGAFGFFLGNSMSNKTKDEQSAKVAATLAERVTSSTSTSGPPAATISVIPWWIKLKNGEPAAITAEAANDPRVMAFVTAANVGAATAADLDYLVSKNLLTRARADEIKAT